MARLPHYHYSFFELITIVVIKNKWTEIKEMEEPGFEPGALYMRSTRDTTTPHSRILNALPLQTQLNSLKFLKQSKTIKTIWNKQQQD